MKEKCREVGRECGYLNFFNDIFELWEKYHINSVMQLKEKLQSLDLISEILVDVSKGNYADVNMAIEEIREILTNYR